MGNVPRLYEKPRACDRIAGARENGQPPLMSEEEWLALPEERRRQIVLMYEKLRRRKNDS